MKRASPLRRTKRLSKVGARATREAEAVRQFRSIVLSRASWKCQRCGLDFLKNAAQLEAHHLKPRARGGSHDPDNGRALCGGPDGCHAQVHDHRAFDWERWIVTTKPARDASIVGQRS